MDYVYLISPFCAWLVAGSLKFVVNSIRARRLAFGLIGYGGFPSNHSAIVSCTTALIAFKEGVANPAFAVALTLSFIVVLDAHSLRRQVGKQAVAINRLASKIHEHKKLRERMGHSFGEIVGGVLVGVTVAFVLRQLTFPRLL